MKMGQATQLDLSIYDTFIFDCDGVILDSNKVKSNSFYKLFRPWGDKLALDLVSYHKKNGGISRFEKIKYFYNTILNKDIDTSTLEELANQYGKYVNDGLYECQITEGFLEFIRQLNVNANKFVVSGGLETEVQDVLKHKHLDSYFKGIYGSPRNKVEIIAGIEKDIPTGRTLFFGDSPNDFIAAEKFQYDFIFISKYTEFEEWPEFCAKKGIASFGTFAEFKLIPTFLQSTKS